MNRLLMFAGFLQLAALASCAPRRQDPGAVLQDTEIAADVQFPISRVEGVVGAPAGAINVCSFNISFLGHWQEKQNAKLAKLLKPCDLVSIQELVATPVALEFSNGDSLAADPEAAAFFQAMKSEGFDSIVSPEDTGRTGNHDNVNRSEFTVAFFKPQRLSPEGAVPAGFIAAPLVGNSVFDRVPYAMPFTIKSGSQKKNDFVLISVHLHWKADGESMDEFRAARDKEIKTVFKWMHAQKQATGERDFLFMGDMNTDRQEDLFDVLGDPSNKLHMTSLNTACAATNVAGNECYDQVMFSRDRADSMKRELFVVDIAKRFDLESAESERQFVKEYSDHHAVFFRYVVRTDDD